MAIVYLAHDLKHQRLPFDIGVVVLEDVPAGLAPVEFPTEGPIDRLAPKAG